MLKIGHSRLGEKVSEDERAIGSKKGAQENSGVVEDSGCGNDERSHVGSVGKAENGGGGGVGEEVGDGEVDGVEAAYPHSGAAIAVHLHLHRLVGGGGAHSYRYLRLVDDQQRSLLRRLRRYLRRCSALPRLHQHHCRYSQHRAHHHCPRPYPLHVVPHCHAS
ncbi:hypothetical protein GOP47_0024252 [Adiantum capillus-veneris]|uniref:Uncharacterized protein n=1 Tax=Adiantum capillus-veneris TaxID=13818 RepID=A0A9D4Z5X9_ADICA|nr:hypothetical protein GOP47_0024252 [Adiantum capillus-veneris]